MLPHLVMAVTVGMKTPRKANPKVRRVSRLGKDDSSLSLTVSFDPFQVGLSESVI